MKQEILKAIIWLTVIIILFVALFCLSVYQKQEQDTNCRKLNENSEYSNFLRSCKIK